MWLINSFDSLLKWVVEMADKHPGAVALVVGTFIFAVHRAQKRDKKSDAAKLILQELWYADAKIMNYRTHHIYTYTEKILPTNNWNANIGLFVNDLDQGELDRISKFYSNAAYLDEVLSMMSAQIVRNVMTPEAPAPKEAEIDTSQLPTAAKDLIARVTGVIDPVYNTPATKKLREIAEKKWYHLF